MKWLTESQGGTPDSRFVSFITSNFVNTVLILYRDRVREMDILCRSRKINALTGAKVKRKQKMSRMDWNEPEGNVIIGNINLKTLKGPK